MKKMAGILHAVLSIVEGSVKNFWLYFVWLSSTDKET